jgi:LPS export ABC transporter protein LptC
VELRKRWLTILMVAVFGIALIISGVAMFQASHQNQSKPGGREKPAEVLDELTGINVKVPGSEKDSYWDLTVSKMVRDQTTARLEGIRGDYVLNKQASYHLTAQTGMIDWRTRTMELSGEVRFWTADGKELTAERIRWDQAQGRIIAEHRVRLKGPGLSLDASKLDASLDLDQVRFSGTTKVTYRR